VDKLWSELQSDGKKVAHTGLKGKNNLAPKVLKVSVCNTGNTLT